MRNDFAPVQAYAGRDLAFTITGGTAEAVDLGEIKLEPAR